jgi:hypothetical protein
MKYTKQSYTDEDIKALAKTTVARIVQGLDDTEFVSAVMRRYSLVWREVLAEQGYPERTFCEDDTLRMRFEAAYFTVMLAGLYVADEYIWRKGRLLAKSDPQAALSFKVQLLHSFAEFLNHNGFTGLRELQGVALEPEIRFAPGGFIDVQKRFDEYMDANRAKRGGEVSVFMHYMAKAVDAPNYPLHELWIGEFGIALMAHAKDCVLHALGDLGFVK